MIRLYFLDERVMTAFFFFGGCFLDIKGGNKENLVSTKFICVHTKTFHKGMHLPPVGPTEFIHINADYNDITNCRAYLYFCTDSPALSFTEGTTYKRRDIGNSYVIQRLMSHHDMYVYNHC